MRSTLLRFSYKPPIFNGRLLTNKKLVEEFMGFKCEIDAKKRGARASARRDGGDAR